MRGASVLSRESMTLMLTAGAVLAAGPTANAQPRRPVYVGAKVCATCHDGENMGHQTTLWLSTRHARAYASLATPEARAIAAISGVPIEPQKSPLCLGCHATACGRRRLGEGRDLLDPRWRPVREVPRAGQRARRFLVGRERSQGRQQDPPDEPGRFRLHEVPQGEAVAYAFARAAPAAAGPAGHALRSRPGPAHAGPSDAQELEARGERSAPAADCPPGDRQVHRVARLRRMPRCTRKRVSIQPLARARSMPELTNHWAPQPPARSPRRRAWRATRRTSVACLKCHSTAYHRASAGVAETYSILEGVGCESCHGAGSAYAPEDVMKDKPRALAAGLLPVQKSTCLACHEQAHGKPFDFETASKLIAHPAQRLPGPNWSCTRRL